MRHYFNVLLNMKLIFLKKWKQSHNRDTCFQLNCGAKIFISVSFPSHQQPVNRATKQIYSFMLGKFSYTVLISKYLVCCDQQSRWARSVTELQRCTSNIQVSIKIQLLCLDDFLLFTYCVVDYAVTTMKIYTPRLHPDTLCSLWLASPLPHHLFCYIHIK